MKLVTAESMSKIEKVLGEKWTLPPIILMENAGRNVADIATSFLRSHPAWTQGVVVCGKGNNGGDGMVVARHLARRFPQLPLTVFLVGNPDTMHGDALTNFAICQNMGIPIVRVLPEKPLIIPPHSFIIDALFGTGLSQDIGGIHRMVIETINAAEESFVLSIDVPSGIDASWGRVMGCAVKANLTVSLGYLKRGLVVSPGREYTGEVRVTDIGIPLETKDAPDFRDGFLITPEKIHLILPHRPDQAHKISVGVAAVVAGNQDMTGAGLLVCQGAYAAGAGMVVWPLQTALAPLVKIRTPEVVSFPLSRRSEKVSFGYQPHHVPEIITACTARKCRAIAIGPGLGQSSATYFFVEKLVQSSPIKGVLDADALNALALHRERWNQQLTGWVITPHEGELARLLGVPVSVIGQNRIASACAATQFFGSVTVLKGPGTIVVSPTGDIAVNPTGNPYLATAGSGDVLTGIIVSFLAQGLSGFDSAITAVFLHGLAGDIAVQEKKLFVASDIAFHIPYAIKVVQNSEYRLSLVDGDSGGTSPHKL